MDRKDKTIRTLAALCLFLAAMLGLTLLRHCERNEAQAPSADDYSKEIRVEHDTIFIKQPAARDSLTTRYIMVKARPAYPDTSLSSKEPLPQEELVEVELPIVQKEYGDSTYRAWVSGYMASLDSIEIYQRREYVKETIRLKERKRWGFTVGPTVGAGWNGGRITPYVGIGITWGYSF